MNGGLSLYNYAAGNPLIYVDSSGTSSLDIEKIQYDFAYTIQQMIDNEQRRPDDSLLPNNGFNNSRGKPFEICEGQVTILIQNLNKEIPYFDDNWRFQVQSGFGHFWVVGISSNDNDPNIYLDPWKDDIGVGVPCSQGCAGWFGRDYDYQQYLKNTKNHTTNAKGWFLGWDLTRPPTRIKE